MHSPRKIESFIWSKDCQHAFDQLKQKLTAAPILTLPCDDCSYVIDTDASDHGIGAVLSQIQNGEERVISYASRLYSDAEKRYCVTRKELLAVVFFSKTLPPIFTRPAVPYTDRSRCAAVVEENPTTNRATKPLARNSRGV